MPDASRLEYERRMHRVLAHIDRHIGEPLDLPTLAGVAHFSAFHFHRLFAAWMGQTLGDYMRRRRVEVAASKLSAQPRLTVLQVALDVGFGSSAPGVHRPRRGGPRRAAPPRRPGRAGLLQPHAALTVHRPVLQFVARRSPAGQRSGIIRTIDPSGEAGMGSLFTLLLWCVLFVLCWPLALLALVLWPVVWLLSLPFRLIGITFGALFALLSALLHLPARMLGHR